MLLMLPGLICDARIFAPQLASFADAHAVDGYGAAASLHDMARHVLAMADLLDASRFDLLGHSMGGRVALEIFRQAPARVARIALLSTGMHPASVAEPAKRRALQAIGWQQGFAALVDQWLPPMVAPANRADPALYLPMRAMCLSQGQQVFDAQVKALLSRPPVEDVLDRIACPALVMTGELDGWAPPAQHEAIAARLANARLAIVPGAGHMLPLEAPEAVNQAIADWRRLPEQPDFPAIS